MAREHRAAEPEGGGQGLSLDFKRACERLRSRRGAGSVVSPMLKRIVTHDVEPADLSVDLAPRLNVLTGDNGLGKTFLLDVAWWTRTCTWSRSPAIPKRGKDVAPEIRWEEDRSLGTGSFNFGVQRWHPDFGARPTLVIYTKPDSGFDIWDPLRESGPHVLPLGMHGMGASHQFSFTPQQVWDGRPVREGVWLSNGLLRDWISWQFQKPQLFDLFTRVLAKLSPHPGEVLRPGTPKRVSIEDARDIPTLVLPYGEVPVTHASAGMRRVLALAYMLLWTWYEHTEAARLQNRAPLDELLLLIDEVDAHLHPTWQRVMVPALFEVIPAIAPALRTQVIVSTHAPLVLASVETMFDPERDALVHFALEGSAIQAHTIPWTKQGDVVNWLVSDAFGLHQGRSREAERAIEAAEAFMRGAPTPPELDTKEAIHTELVRVLAAHDDFWPRWLVNTGVVR